MSRPRSSSKLMLLIAAAVLIALPLSAANGQDRMQTGDGLLLINAQLPAEIRAGEQFEYRVTVQNSSDNVALHNIKLKQSEAEGFTIESVSMQGNQQQQGQSNNQQQQEGNQDPQQRQRNQGQQQNSVQESQRDTQSQQSNQRNSVTKNEMTVDKLEPGQSKTFVVTAAADNEGELKSCLQVISYEPSLCLTAKVVKPELRITKNAPEKADRCNAIELQYAVTNDGTGDIETFQIVDELGDGLKTIDGESTLQFNVDGLRAGDTRTFVARVFATRPGTFSSRAIARAQDSKLRARSAQTSTEVVAADLAVRVEGPGRLYGESVAQFTAQVTNVGNTPAEQVTVNVMWPEQGRLVDISDYRVMSTDRGQSGQWQNQNQSPQAISSISQDDAENQNQSETNQGSQQDDSQPRMSSDQFVIDRLEPGQSATFQYAVRAGNMEEVQTRVQALYVCAVEMAEGEDQAVNRVSASGMGTARFVRLPAMQLFVVDDEDPVARGTNVTYTIRVTNEGDATEQNVQLTATLPEGLQFEAAEGPTQHEANGTEITFQPIQSMAPGDTVDYKVTATNSGEGSVSFRATLSSESLDEDVIGEEPTQLVSAASNN